MSVDFYSNFDLFSSGMTYRAFICLFYPISLSSSLIPVVCHLLEDPLQVVFIIGLLVFVAILSYNLFPSISDFDIDLAPSLPRVYLSEYILEL